MLLAALVQNPEAQERLAEIKESSAKNKGGLASLDGRNRA
jgi:hypothetical protein